MQPAPPQNPYPYAQQQQQPMMPAANMALAAGPFAHTRYTLKQSYWAFLGRVTRVYAPDGTLVAYVKRTAFKWKPEMTLFADEARQQPLMVMRTRQVTVNPISDLCDAATGARIGIIRRRTLKSLFRGTWELLDERDQQIGLMREDGASFLRRLFPILLGKWHIELMNQRCAYVRQVWRFFTKEYTLDLSENQGRLDPRLAIVCAVLALLAESRRERS